jgi:uncharacterized membrane protein YtjA (UPF0391 family)
MKTKPLGLLSMICLATTILWLVFLVTGRVIAGPLDTFEQVLGHVGKVDVLFLATYANAALVTVSAIMLFAALHVYCRLRAATWSTIGFAFVPVYGALNLIVYLSQITVVPQLVAAQAKGLHSELVVLLLRQAIQEWPDSAAFIVNNLAYAVLGVPSVVFGLLLFSRGTLLRASGVLLALSGVAGILGFSGIAARCTWLSHGSLVGGVLFLLALVPMTWAFLRVADADTSAV